MNSEQRIDSIISPALMHNVLWKIPPQRRYVDSILHLTQLTSRTHPVSRRFKSIRFTSTRCSTIHQRFGSQDSPHSNIAVDTTDSDHVEYAQPIPPNNPASLRTHGRVWSQESVFCSIQMWKIVFPTTPQGLLAQQTTAQVNPLCIQCGPRLAM